MGIIAPFRRRTFARPPALVVDRGRRGTPSAFRLIVATFLGGAFFFVFWNFGQALVSLPVAKAFTQQNASRFGNCGYISRSHCVVDGDTFILAGERIRIADIDAPETDGAKCATEAALGTRATVRLRELLNERPFELQAYGSRDLDQYGRKLRIVTRDGKSLGDILIAEGLARRWDGRRRSWCA